jgi:hypothetical protein
MASFSDLTDEDIDKLVALGEIPDKQSFLQQQLATAQGIRDQPLNTLTQGRRVSTAATPLGMLGQIGTKMIGGYQANQLGNQRQNLLDQQASGRKAYFDMIRRGISPTVGDGTLMPTGNSGQA